MKLQCRVKNVEILRNALYFLQHNSFDRSYPLRNVLTGTFNTIKKVLNMLVIYFLPTFTVDSLFCSFKLINSLKYLPSLQTMARVELKEFMEVQSAFISIQIRLSTALLYSYFHGRRGSLAHLKTLTVNSRVYYFQHVHILNQQLLSCTFNYQL